MENNNNKNNNGILPVDLFNRFFGLEKRSSRGLFDIDDMFRGFDDMQREINRIFNNLSTNAPKELVREYETQEGGKVREVGPIVYGYSMTIGPDGKPRIREFGNVKPTSAGRSMDRIGRSKPQISAEREPLSDVNV